MDAYQNDDDSEVDLFMCLRNEDNGTHDNKTDTGARRPAKKVKLDSKIAMALDPSMPETEMSKATKTRREFWRAMNFSIKHHVPLTAHTADHAHVFEMLVLHVEYTPTDTVFTVRMPMDVAAELIESYSQHTCVKLERVGIYTNLYKIHMANSTDIIMHVLSQGSRDPPGTVKGHTNCWAVKMNSSKFNRKPMGRTLLVPLAHPTERTQPFFKRVALVKAAIANKNELDAVFRDTGTGHVIEHRLVRLDGYSGANAFFVVSFIDDSSQRVLEFVPTMACRVHTDAVLLNNERPHAVMFQSDHALVHALHDTDCMRFRSTMRYVNDQAKKIVVEIDITLPESDSLNHTAARELAALIDAIPDVDPYNPLKLRQPNK